jgi:DEAD/DEAH box helicase domain-containing protein
MDDEALRRLLTSDEHEQVVSVSHRAARAARWAPIPNELAPELREALVGQGVKRLYSHQREAFDLLNEGEHVVVATNTASGKSLCFTLPTLDSYLKDDTSRALYLYPTKALAQDQARKLSALRLRGGGPAL